EFREIADQLLEHLAFANVAPGAPPQPRTLYRRYIIEFIEGFRQLIDLDVIREADRSIGHGTSTLGTDHSSIRRSPRDADPEGGVRFAGASDGRGASGGATVAPTSRINVRPAS